MNELTQEMKDQFNAKVIKWADTPHPFCPTPGCTAGSVETGRICSKLPHTSPLPEFLEDSDTVTIEGKPLC
jgi:hypothetical protein